MVAVTAAQFGNHRDEFLLQFLKSNHEQTERPQKSNQLILKPSALQPITELLSLSRQISHGVFYVIHKLMYLCRATFQNLTSCHKESTFFKIGPD